MCDEEKKCCQKPEEEKKPDECCPDKPKEGQDDAKGPCESSCGQ